MFAYIKKFIPQKAKIALRMIDALFIRTFHAIKGIDYRCNKDTKRCFDNRKSQHYKYEYFAKDTPICCASNLYKILIDTTEILEEHNITYFISFGTLLGSIRHGGLIPWDTDIDIVVSEKDKEKIFTILKKELLPTYVVSDDGKDGVSSILRVNYSKTNTLHIDIFTYVCENDDIIFGYNRRFKKASVFPLKKLKFHHHFLFAPKNDLEQLATFYGKDYMKYAYKQWALNTNKFQLTVYKPADIELAL